MRTLKHYFSFKDFEYIYNINSFYAAQFMFSYYHQLPPPLFLDLFVTSRHIHNYNTRISPHFRSHACRTNTKQLTILFQGPKIRNSLPNSITLIFILQSFKTIVFDFFIMSIMHLVYPPLLCVDIFLLLNIIVTRGRPRTSLVVS